MKAAIPALESAITHLTDEEVRLRNEGEHDAADAAKTSANEIRQVLPTLRRIEERHHWPEPKLFEGAASIPTSATGEDGTSSTPTPESEPPAAKEGDPAVSTGTPGPV